MRHKPLHNHWTLSKRAKQLNLGLVKFRHGASYSGANLQNLGQVDCPRLCFVLPRTSQLICCFLQDAAVAGGLAAASLAAASLVAASFAAAGLVAGGLAAGLANVANVAE